MNRIDRISAILIHLQSKKIVKAQEIADRFEISLRTVYRDIKTLEESGVPMAGEAGVGYRIMDGYRLPPVQFTKEEAMALLTAEKMVEKLTDKTTAQHYNSAMFKIKAVMRYADKDMLEDMANSIAVLNNPYLPIRPTGEIHLQTILKAIAAREVLNAGYFANHNQQYATRDIEPVGIFLAGNYWYMIGWCRLRSDYRTFRTDRISYLNNTGEIFAAAHPTLKSFLQKLEEEKQTTTVIIRVEKNILHYFGDQKYYNGFVSQKEDGNRIEMTFITSSLPGFAKFFLLFGDHADILTPASLKTMVLDNIAAIQKKLED